MLTCAVFLMWLLVQIFVVKGKIDNILVKFNSVTPKHLQALSVDCLWDNITQLVVPCSCGIYFYESVFFI